MDHYDATRERLYLLKSRDLYRQAFEAYPKDYYTGINAAAKSLFLDEHETAAQLAKRVEGLVGDKPISGDYWKSATVAEVQLLQGNFEKAADLYLQAILEAAKEHGSHQATCGQAKRILDSLQAPAELRKKVLSAFVHEGCPAST